MAENENSVEVVEEENSELEELKKENFRLTALLQENTKGIPSLLFPSKPDIVMYNAINMELTIVINGKTHKIGSINKDIYLKYVEFLENSRNMFAIRG